MKFIFTFCFTLLCLSLLNAQFTDSTNKLFKADIGGSVNKTGEGSAYLFNNNLSFAVRKKKTIFNAAAGWLYGASPEKLTNNDFTANSNINLFFRSERFYYWGLVNYTSSYSLNIKSQGQAAVGVAYNILNKENIWLNVSNGIMAEDSRIIDNTSNSISYQTIRNTLRVQFLYKPGNRFSIKTVNFFQPSFKFIRDHIISSDSQLSYKIWKGIGFNAQLTYNKISRTGKENLIFTYGFGYERYF